MELFISSAATGLAIFLFAGIIAMRFEAISFFQGRTLSLSNCHIIIKMMIIYPLIIDY